MHVHLAAVSYLASSSSSSWPFGVTHSFINEVREMVSTTTSSRCHASTDEELSDDSLNHTVSPTNIVINNSCYT